MHEECIYNTLCIYMLYVVLFQDSVTKFCKIKASPYSHITWGKTAHETTFFWHKPII